MVGVVSFTGSHGDGRRVGRQAADTFKRVVLELGGKSANVICADADLDRVAANVVMGFTAHAGQGGTLLTRTLVHRSRYDDLVAKLPGLLTQPKIGDPAHEGTHVGP